MLEIKHGFVSAKEIYKKKEPLLNQFKRWAITNIEKRMTRDVDYKLKIPSPWNQMYYQSKEKRRPSYDYLLTVEKALEVSILLKCDRELINYLMSKVKS